MLDRLFFICLIINGTSLYSYLAFLSGTKISDVSIVLLILQSVYIILKTRETLSIILKTQTALWFLFIVVWPLATISYSSSYGVDDIGLAFYYFTLLLGTMIYISSVGFKKIFRILTISIGITLIGMIASYVNPRLFDGIAAISGGKTEFYGRPFGLFMQPNILATAIILLFIGWFALLQNRNRTLEIIILITFLAIILFTGSRLGILGAGLAIAISFSYSSFKRLINGELFIRLLLVSFCLLLVVITARQIIPNLKPSGTSVTAGLTERMDWVLNFRLTSGEKISESGSFTVRRQAQNNYWEHIKKRPLLGHGFDTEHQYLSNDIFTSSAHSQFLSSAFEYGIPYSIFFVFLISLIYCDHRKNNVQKVLGTNTILQFSVITIFFFILGGLFEHRLFYIVLGIILSLYQLKQDKYKNDQSNNS